MFYEAIGGTFCSQECLASIKKQFLYLHLFIIYLFIIAFIFLLSFLLKVMSNHFEIEEMPIKCRLIQIK